MVDFFIKIYVTMIDFRPELCSACLGLSTLNAYDVKKCLL